MPANVKYLVFNNDEKSEKKKGLKLSLIENAYSLAAKIKIKNNLRQTEKKSINTRKIFRL